MMKMLLIALMLVAAAWLAGCSEQSIDRTLQDESVAGSMVEEGESAPDRASRRHNTDGNNPDEVGNGRVRVRPTWRNVLKFQGQSDKKSNSFSIDSEKWAISWKTQPGRDGDGEFIVLLYDKESPDTPAIDITSSPQDGVLDMENPGVFYIEVLASQPYTIEVKEFR